MTFAWQGFQARILISNWASFSPSENALGNSHNLVPNVYAHNDLVLLGYPSLAWLQLKLTVRAIIIKLGSSGLNLRGVGPSSLDLCDSWLKASTVLYPCYPKLMSFPFIHSSHRLMDCRHNPYFMRVLLFNFRIQVFGDYHIPHPLPSFLGLLHFISKSEVYPYVHISIPTFRVYST
jgi:hypothetical protein